jgi:MFS family permease
VEHITREGILSQIRDGFSYAACSPEIRTLLLSFAAVACTARGIMELAPSIAAAALGGGVETLSLLTSSIALGALLGIVSMPKLSRWRPRSMIVTTLSGAAVALCGYGSSGRILLALVGALLLGCTLGINHIYVTSAIQLHAAPRYRGRVNSIYNMIFKGGPAIGAVLFGWIAQMTDIRTSNAVAAVSLLLLVPCVVYRVGASTKPVRPQAD